MRIKNSFIISVVAVAFLLTGTAFGGNKQTAVKQVKGKQVAACITCFLVPAQKFAANDVNKDNKLVKISNPVK